MTDTPTLNKNSKTYIYICEMFIDGLTIQDISKHLQIDKKLVKLVLKENFGSTTREKKPPRVIEVTLPNITGDIFLCQLALIANINKKTFYDFTNTVRENYPEILVYFQAKINDFYKTPDLDYETDLYIKRQD